MKWLEIGEPSSEYIYENILDSDHERGGFELAKKYPVKFK
jgi:hypothetical protein